MPRMKKRSLAEQAEALWPLGWKADEGDEGEAIAASVGAVQIRITRLDTTEVSAYNNEQPLFDGDEFDTLEEAIEALHEAVTDFYSTKVPPLARSAGSSDGVDKALDRLEASVDRVADNATAQAQWSNVQAGLVERLMASKDFVEAERDIYRAALESIIRVGKMAGVSSKATLIAIAQDAIKEATAKALKPRGAT